MSYFKIAGGHTRPVPITLGESPETQAERGLQAFFKMETVSREVPLPLGEGAAKRRVRAESALIRPFGPPSPEGRRTRPASFLLSWTPPVIDRPCSYL